MLDGYFMYDAVRRCTATQFATMRAIGAVRWRAVGVEIGHYGAVRFGLDGRTVATVLVAVVLAIVLGGWEG